MVAVVPDEDTAWSAVLRRDRSFDGLFVTGVISTGIYCRPSCAARHPARKNVRFFSNGDAASAAGLRACLRCLPNEVARDRHAVALALELLMGDTPPPLKELSAQVGYTPHHFLRLFQRDLGVTPAAWVRRNRLRRAIAEIADGASVTEAIYAAGYSAPSRFYADKKLYGEEN